MSEEKNVVLTREVQRRLKATTMEVQLHQCIKTAFASGRGTGWGYELASVEVESLGERGWKYTQGIKFGCDNPRAFHKFPAILRRLSETCCAGSLASTPWVLTDSAGTDVSSSEVVEKAKALVTRREQSKEEKRLGEVSLEPAHYFDHLFGREPHIRRIHDALRVGVASNWAVRKHVILEGPPGTGKTALMQATAEMLGEENKAWLWMDATSMTKAGVMQEILGSPTVPPVFFIEEIEKCAEPELRFLLGIMDDRGQVRRTNYRVGNQCKDVRMVVIATANDQELLQKMLAGALYSRFQNDIYCGPPSASMMRQILQREVKAVNGNLDWIDAALEFALDEWLLTDPREVINICVCGGDRLLDGSFQQDYNATKNPRALEERDAKRQERDKQEHMENMRAKGIKNIA